MPIRVVTREVSYIHVLSLTLEHSTPMSCLAAPGLTSPRALRSRVLQASSTFEDVFECSKHLIKCFWIFKRVPRVIFQVLPIASRLWGALASKSWSYMVREVLALHMEYPPSLRLNRRIRLRVTSVFFLLYFPKTLKNKSFLLISHSPRALNQNPFCSSSPRA